LREFTFGHARQLESVLRAHLVALAARTDMLVGMGVSRQPCKPRVDQDRLSVIFTLPGRTTCEASQPDHRHRRSRR
jgi:hypothetical protein